MKKHDVWILFLWAFMVSIPVGAQEEDVAKTEADSRELILRYGMETDVIALLNELAQEKADIYNTHIIEMIKEIRDPQILQGVFRLWSETSYRGGIPFAHEELEKVVEDYDYSEPIILSAIAYLGALKNLESVELLMQLIKNRNTTLAASAVRAIGTIGFDTEKISAKPLLEQLKSIDREAEDELSTALILALGEMRYREAADELLFIIEDTAASKGQRRMACVSIGKIGREKDYPLIERLYLENDDAFFRAYALAGLAEFPHNDSIPVLVQALKRDSFWRIRLTAAEKLTGNNSEDIQELLRYKAANDPVKQVRKASLEALAGSSRPESQSYLADYYADENRDSESRIFCLTLLLKNRIPGTISAVQDVMERLWEKDTRRFLEFTGRELSYIDWEELAPLYNKMLEHENWLIVVYGIRGIRRNGLALKEKIKALDIDGTDGRIRREIQLEP